MTKKKDDRSEDQRNYNLCDEITEEILALPKECCILELELKKDNRSKGYHSKKISLMSTSSNNFAQPPSEYETVSMSHDTVMLSGDDVESEESSNCL